MAWYPSASRQFPDGAQRRLDLGEPVLAIEQPPRADGRSAWHDRPAGSAEVDAGRSRNGHDCGVPAEVAFPCTSLSGPAYCRGTKDLVYRGYGLRRPWLVVQGEAIMTTATRHGDL